MGREVRRVPQGWDHPKDAEGNHIPLDDGYSRRLKKWLEGKEKWDNGLREDWRNGGWKALSPEENGMAFEEWNGECPESMA